MKRDLKADLELCNKATPGPWKICHRHDRRGLQHSQPRSIQRELFQYKSYALTLVMTADGKYMICDCLPVWFLDEGVAPENHVPNLQFIAEAREGWPHAIERALKAEALAQKLLDVLGRVIPRYLVGRLERDLDSVSEATVVRGEWNPIFKGADTCECSVCKEKGVVDSDYGFIATPFCPNCGAKMEVPGDE